MIYYKIEGNSINNLVDLPASKYLTPRSVYCNLESVLTPVTSRTRAASHHNNHIITNTGSTLHLQTPLSTASCHGLYRCGINYQPAPLRLPTWYPSRGSCRPNPSRGYHFQLLLFQMRRELCQRGIIPWQRYASWIGHSDGGYSQLANRGSLLCIS
ncbi:hypothetical protein DPMN_011501 [Dreissena polymorpha]|uniref:Uncharacterized protein n=1 Tax=Dreissena polymorpha TaxID=45954 RepID=A0A9D4N574_DREPO|nr:hypothetical protein DPMN_011501 [Dreissena polymorpha]